MDIVCTVEFQNREIYNLQLEIVIFSRVKSAVNPAGHTRNLADSTAINRKPRKNDTLSIFSQTNVYPWLQAAHCHHTYPTHQEYWLNIFHKTYILISCTWCHSSSLSEVSLSDSVSSSYSQSLTSSPIVVLVTFIMISIYPPTHPPTLYSPSICPPILPPPHHTTTMHYMHRHNIYLSRFPLPHHQGAGHLEF